jgi:hypothetical protein
MTDLKLVALGFGLCAWCEFAQAQVQSRTDTIESARTEKDDQQGHFTALPNAGGRQIPAFSGTEYLAATISCGGRPGEACPGPVTVYLRRAASRIEVVGIDR